MMWLTKATNKGACERCHKTYSKGEIVGVISLTHGHTHNQSAFHPLCWLDTGLSAFKAATERSRLNGEQQEDRARMVKYWAQLNHREKQLKAKGGESMDSNLRRVEKIRNELRLEMTLLGGVPEGWE